MIDMNQYDVIVLGGGLAGLTLTKQLLMARPQTRVLIVEKRSFPVEEAAFKVGESTVEIGAHYLADVVGLKKHLIDDQLPKFGLRFFFKQGDQSLAEGTEVGGSEFFAAPGYQVDRGRLENHLTKAVADMGATFLSPADVVRVDLADEASGGAGHQVVFKHAGHEQSVISRWVVDASGRAGILKRQLGLAEAIDHNVNAVWFRIASELRIDDWCSDPQWQTRTGKVPRRWLSTNHLLGPGYWVWIIPLASGATSIGIVADPRMHPLTEINQFDKALAWLEKHEPLCAETIAPHQDKLQDFLAIKRLGHSCRQVFSPNRWAITGEAGVFLDPLYSPGIDYIAIGNSMICRLLQDDAEGIPIDQLAPRLENTFLTLFRNNLLTYEDQYPLFGNPRIMSLKYVWDYALYWGFPALLYFNEKLSDPGFIQSMGSQVEDLRVMNQQMQQFFRDWEALDRDIHADPVFVDQHEIDILTQLNAELRDRLDDRELRDRFARNTKILSELQIEIMQRIQRSRPELESAQETKPVTEHRLDRVFEALNL